MKLKCISPVKFISPFSEFCYVKRIQLYKFGTNNHSSSFRNYFYIFPFVIPCICKHNQHNSLKNILTVLIKSITWKDLLKIAHTWRVPAALILSYLWVEKFISMVCIFMDTFRQQFLNPTKTLDISRLKFVNKGII